MEDQPRCPLVELPPNLPVTPRSKAKSAAAKKAAERAQRQSQRLEFASVRINDSIMHRQSALAMHGSKFLNPRKKSMIEVLKQQERYVNRILFHGTRAPHSLGSFPMFSKLPDELQQMIWSFALADALPFVEAYKESSKGRFKAAGPVAQILSLCGLSYNGVETISIPSRFCPQTSAILIRPKIDVLYLPHLNQINVHGFVANPSNQCIEHVALALPSRQCTSQLSDNLFAIYELTRGLANLRTVTMVDGWMKGDEAKLDRSRYQNGHDHHWWVVELPEFWAASNWRSNWCNKDVELFREDFTEMVGVVRKYEVWVKPPEIIGLRLLRSFIWKDAESRPETEIEEWRGIGAVEDWKDWTD